MDLPTPSPSFNQTDFRILRGLGLLQRLALVLLMLIAGAVFWGWVLPPLGSLLPPGWNLMKANTGFLVLLSTLSTLLNEPRRRPGTARIGRLLGALVALVAATTLVEFASGRAFWLDTIFAADAHSIIPGRMSSQTALSFLWLGVVLFNLHARKGLLSRIADAVALLLCLLMLVYIAAYLFGALSLLGVTIHISPQALACLVLLTLIVFCRRMEFGAFSVLVDSGIGGKTARLTAPISLLLPFALPEIRQLILHFHFIPEQYGVALIAAALSLVGFCFVVLLSGRCRQLEAITRELSLRDQLTQLYNRRGFLLFAEQSLRLARRNGMEFFLLFIDMDNLKKLNDNLGHEAGSLYLQQMARLLQNTFRVSDVIGRIGGDEFVVAGNSTLGHATDFIARLQLNENAEQTLAPHQFPLSFSLGQVTAEPNNTETLEALIRRADLIMYEVKRKKRDSRRASDDPIPGWPHPLNHDGLHHDGLRIAN